MISNVFIVMVSHSKSWIAPIFVKASYLLVDNKNKPVIKASNAADAVIVIWLKRLPCATY